MSKYEYGFLHIIIDTLSLPENNNTIDEMQENIEKLNKLEKVINDCKFSDEKKSNLLKYLKEGRDKLEVLVPQ